MKRLHKILCSVSAACILTISALPLSACSSKEDELVLRVSNWEEYIDRGKWGDDELIDIDNPYDTEADGIIGVNELTDDFTEWFNNGNHGFKVRVEYSTFGTNEDLYNRLNLGDTYDLVCPSDYMLMKLINEDKAEKFSESFHDKNIETNYYAKNVSPYIDDVFSAKHEENADYVWKDYAACYMWGTTGLVYNPETVSDDDVTSWNILQNGAYKRRVTIKDNVRDAYFAALGILNAEVLTTLNKDVNTAEESSSRSELLNATDDETIAAAQQILKDIKDNVYSFETDSGKTDMITGKVAANFQWSGDGVLIMDETDDDGETELWYSVPDECTNLWFDGWVMLKDGIGGDERKKTAAEAFINFLSRPDNAVRNMYFIGYTSAIAGDPDGVIKNYLEWNYGAEDGVKTYNYDLSYFFGDECVISVDAETLEIGEDGNINRGRQLFAQYPPQNVIDRSVIMLDFGERLGAINQMWINVRCLDVKDFNPAVVWSILGIILAGSVAITLYKFRYRIFYKQPKPKKIKSATN